MGLISNGTTIFNNGAMATGIGTNMKFESSATASDSSSIAFTLGSEKMYIFHFVDVHAATNAVKFTFQVSTDSGSSYGVTHTNVYHNAYHAEGGAGGAYIYEVTGDSAQTTNEVELVRENKMSGDNDHCCTGHLHLVNPSNNSEVTQYFARTQNNHEAEYSMDSYIAGYFNDTNDLTHIRFKMSSGNIQAGKIIMYSLT